MSDPYRRSSHAPAAAASDQAGLGAEVRTPARIAADVAGGSSRSGPIELGWELDRPWVSSSAEDVRPQDDGPPGASWPGTAFTSWWGVRNSVRWAWHDSVCRDHAAPS